MKIINSINKYLLERYPTIWNTKLVWMLLTSFLIHIVSFIIGYLFYNSPESLQTDHILSDYFVNGLFILHAIVSVVLLVVWIYKMFQNNAFNNFYPLSKNQLFGQFLQYILIVFVSTTFFISYMLGVKTCINSKYSNETLKEWKDNTDIAMAFLPQKATDYLLTERKYPQLFSDLYCETSKNKIDYSQVFYTSYDYDYQFYTIKLDTVVTKGSSYDIQVIEGAGHEDSSVINYDYKDNYVVIYKKDKVINMDTYIKTTDLSFLNYSANKTVNRNYLDDTYYGNELNYETILNDSLSNGRILLNKKVQELLQSDKKGVEKIMKSFLEMSNKLKIENNLNLEDWKKIVFTNNENFPVTKFIYLSEFALKNVEKNKIYQDKLEAYFENNKSNFYYQSNNLNNLFYSIDSIKNFKVFSEYLSVYIWLSTLLSLVILSLRITSLKILVFAVVSLGVLSLVVGFISLIFALTTSSYLAIFGLYIFVGIMIFFIPIVFNNLLSKKIISIAIVMSLVTLPYLIFSIIKYIDDIIASYSVTDEDYYNRSFFLQNYSNEQISIVVFLLTLIILYIYKSIIMRWKASVE